jgi:hypothetical protein
MYSKIQCCRICGNDHLEPVLDLGEQTLTGVFPRSRARAVTRGPLRLVKCFGESHCGLLQLEHSYDLGEMYGENYGYRSGLNPSMVAHLHGKVRRLLRQVAPGPGDIVLDIGSNDSTTLQAYPVNGATLVGIDPTGTKFRSYYPAHIALIPEFFSAATFRQRFGERRAKVVTSFSMFYDLEDPLGFMREVHEVLEDDGLWVFEQSYMPTMLRTNSFDTVCHEHLEYYALKQIQWMAVRAGFVIVDVEFNDVNGGSFSVTVRKADAGVSTPAPVLALIEQEGRAGLDSLAPYAAFAGRVAVARDELRRFVQAARHEGKTVAALGASTKGNVILQYCGFSERDIVAIGEVNADKFGCFTPGTWIPIVPEAELLARRPDYAIVLPWHFRRFFVGNGRFAGVTLVLPLPKLEFVRG